MNAEEVRAAGYLRSMINSDLFTIEQDGDKRSLGSKGVSMPWKIWNACKVIINAYLAASPGDADTPIDAAWLEAVGFKRLGSGLWPRLFFEDLDGDASWIDVCSDGKAQIDDHVTVICKTRGDLIDLCKALGVTLKTAKGE